MTNEPQNQPRALSVPHLPPLTIGTLTLDPPLLSAPMAGITHSAFRRLVADFGGYGALYTEMLSARALSHEEVLSSPFSKRRPAEGRVIYQLLVDTPESVRLALDRLEPLSPAAIDINLGCPAPEVKKRGGGATLFLDRPRLEKVLREARRYRQGPLLVKCRLGETSPHWRTALCERLRLFEDQGVEAVVLHPRFFDEKLKRIARWEEVEWLASQTRLPVIGNGDIVSTANIDTLSHKFPSVAGFMIGRALVAQPWLFAAAVDPFAPRDIDYLDIWQRLCRYTREDFPPHKALGRIKVLTTYFARNFMFGHELFRVCRGARSVDEVQDHAIAFLTAHPATVGTPSFAGI